MIKPYFTHISRFFSARLLFYLHMSLLWLGLGALITINILTLRSTKPMYWDKLMMFFASPFSGSRSIDLATVLWKQGYHGEARKLLASTQSNVLGETTADPRIMLSQWEQEAQEVKKRYNFWLSVSAARPDYRDAFITLASLAYEQGKIDETRTFLNRAQSLDPNFPIIRNFLSVLEKK